MCATKPKTKSVENISNTEYLNAWHNWCEHPHTDPGKALMQYIGAKCFYSVSTDTIGLPPEAAHRLRLLLSPHYMTIIKAWYARQET